MYLSKIKYTKTLCPHAYFKIYLTENEYNELNINSDIINNLHDFIELGIKDMVIYRLVRCAFSQGLHWIKLEIVAI